MLSEAREFLGHLSDAQQSRVLFPVTSDERFDWAYVPRERSGIPIKEMDEEQRSRAHALLRSALSETGYGKATEIMALETILGQIERRPPDEGYRDPEKYYFTLYGDVKDGGVWGWRVDGHHLSLNVTLDGTEVLGSTPTFFGSNPAEVRQGVHKGKRILHEEEDIARDLLKALASGRRNKAIISEEAPSDIITRMDRRVGERPSEGLAVSEMSEGERAHLLKLLDRYVHNLAPDLAARHLARVQAAGTDTLWFAWAGGPDRGEKHYYRIHGPTLWVEYDNTQNDANHVHTVLRDVEKDFGEDALKEHYENAGEGHSHD